MKSSIVLIGPEDSEKTQIGIELSKLLEWPFIDADQMFLDISKTSIEDFVEKYGVEKFREYESKLIKKVCETYKATRIIFKPGAEAAVHSNNEYREQNRRILSEFGVVIYLLPAKNLEESAVILAERSRKYHSGHIPSLTGGMHRLYLTVSDALVYTEGKTAQETAEDISKFVR